MGLAIPLMVAGTGMQAMSAYRQGQYQSMQAKAQAGMSNYNAQVAETNAEAIKQKSIFDQIRSLKRGSRIQSAIRAKQGASGAVLSEGAPSDVLAEQAAENALDVALIGYEGQVGAAKQKSAASMYRAEASNYMAAAKNYERAGKTAAWTTGLTGLGNMFLLTGFDTFGGGGGENYLKSSIGQPIYRTH